jgi:hypothetical protein
MGSGGQRSMALRTNKSPIGNLLYVERNELSVSSEEKEKPRFRKKKLIRANICHFRSLCSGCDFDVNDYGRPAVQRAHSKLQAAPARAGDSTAGILSRFSLTALRGLCPLTISRSPVRDGRVAVCEGRCTVCDGRYTVCDGRCTVCDGRYTVCDGRYTVCDGRCTLCDGRYTVCDGRCTLCDGRCTLCDGRCTLCDGRCTVCDGRCTVRDGRCTVRDGRCTVRGGRRTVRDGRRFTRRCTTCTHA